MRQNFCVIQPSTLIFVVVEVVVQTVFLTVYCKLTHFCTSSSKSVLLVCIQQQPYKMFYSSFRVCEYLFCFSLLSIVK
jgi:hypothetical protein